MVLALKDDFVGGLLPRKLGPHLVCQRDKKMLQPSSNLVFRRPATFKESFITVKEISFLEGHQPPKKYRGIAKLKP